MDAPQPTENIELDSWGVFFALDADQIFWFPSQEELLAFLYLGAGQYLRMEWTKKQPLAAELRDRWPEIQCFLSEGGLPSRYFDELELKVRQVSPILWWGQFAELLESDMPFPAELRDLFFRSSGFVRIPKKQELQIDHYEEWLLALDGTDEFYVSSLAAHSNYRLSPPRAGYRFEGGVWIRND